MDEGLAILHGDHQPEGVEVMPFTLIPSFAQNALSESIGYAAGFGNVVAQGLNAGMQAQGLVRLAPQTMEALKAAQPMVKEGWNLGTLTSGGKYAHSIRWLPATGAQAISVVTAIGPALTMMAIQSQLNEISALAKHNLELTTSVLRVLHEEAWTQVTGYHKTLLRQLEYARHVNSVTDSIYKEVRGYEVPLSAQWNRAQEAVKRCFRGLSSKSADKDRRQSCAGSQL